MAAFDLNPHHSTKPKTSTMRKHTLTALLLTLSSPVFAQHAHSNTPAQADREAIKAMAGHYHVRFAFDETAVLTAEVQRMQPQRSGAHELVLLIEDSPQRIVLQHILLDTASGHVTKHWRQDWHYQAPRRWEFAADQTWVMRDIAADQTQGAWTQCVYEVSDAPRYCGTGRFNHRYGVATWTSDRTWRPLPRREYTKRSDYNAINAQNRHTIVPGGFTHEQDNSKTQRNADGSTARVLVREMGFNDYRRTSDVDFGPAYAYWQATEGYWARVRQHWTQALASGGLKLNTTVDGMALITPLFAQAKRVQEGHSVSDAEIQAVFGRWVEPLPATATASKTRP